MQSGIYKDTTHSHTQRPFCEYQPSSKQRNLNRHSYRQIPMEMYRRRNGGGGLLLGGVGRVGLGRGKLLCREHPLAGPCSLPGLVGVCLGEGCCIGPLPSPPGRGPPGLQRPSLSELVGAGLQSCPLRLPPPPSHTGILSIWVGPTFIV